jgi:outer membrane protein assembly factor BamB
MVKVGCCRSHVLRYHGAMRRGSQLLLSLLLIASLGSLTPTWAKGGASHVGWLGDGTSVYPKGTARASWGEAQGVAWSTELPEWGNGSPVPIGDRILVTVEPLTLMALSAKDGRVLWTHEARYVDTLSGATRARGLSEAAEAIELRAQLDAQQKTLNRLKRDMRKARGGTDTRAKVEAATAKATKLRDRLRELGPHLLPEPIPVMGNVPSTPLTDGNSIYAVFGNGVVLSLTLDGAVRWGRFLGRPEQHMRGFQRGQAAAPLWVDGHLVVAMNELYALNPATGATVWKSVKYNDYGPPAVVAMEGGSVLVTPKGEAIRASDGEVLLTGLGSVYYRSPVVEGRSLWFIGAEDNPDEMVQHLSRVDLSGDLKNLKSTQVYRRKIVRGKSYSHAVLHKGKLYLLGRQGQWSILRAKDGEPILQATIDFGSRAGASGDEACFATPVIAGNRIVVSTADGRMVVLELSDQIKVLGRSALDGMRATPAFVGKRMYLRTFERLWAIDAD